MGDFVGVDPQLLRQLADRLQDLAGVLAKDGPAIVSAMQDQDHRLDLSVLSQVGARSGEDARTLTKRADLAMELQQQTVPGFGLNADAVFTPHATQPPNFVSLTPDPSMIEVPWDITDQAYALEATRDANRLQAALANVGAPGSTDTITQVGQLLSDHIDDKTYMQAFFAAGGLSSAQQVARALHTVDGTQNGNQVLTSASQQVVAMYGNALASATRLQAQGDITSLDVNGLKNPPNGDMWSEGMLFKYGPTGDLWDHTALATASAAMLDWRKSTQVRPGYTAPTGGSAGGFTDPSNAWYASLGLAVDYVDHNAPPDVLAARLAGIRDNDPSIALMQRLSENPGAARDLLGGDDDASRGYAHDLVNDKWSTPQEFGGAADDSLWPGRVIEAATLDRVTSPQIAALSAQAAANIFQAGADNYNDSGLKTDEKDLYKGLPHELSMSLASMASGYLPDLAQNTDWGDFTGPDGKIVNVPFGVVAGGDPPLVQSGGQAMTDFLSMVMSDNVAGLKYVNNLNGMMSLAAVNAGKDPETAKTLMGQFGELRGRTELAAIKVKWDQAAALDAVNSGKAGDVADANMWLNAVGGFAASIPSPPFLVKHVVVDQSFGYVKALIWGALPIASSSGGLFQAPSTDNAQKVAEAAQPIMFNDKKSLEIPIVEGLLAAGKITPPPNHPDWSGGTVVLNTKNDYRDLQTLWDEQVSKLDQNLYQNLYTEAQSGYDRGTVEYRAH